MKIILTEDQYEQLTEMIKLDIKVGDTIMGGKFKNKKVVVKTIENDAWNNILDIAKTDPHPDWYELCKNTNREQLINEMFSLLN
jgi:hypothetical protein